MDEKVIIKSEQYNFKSYWITVLVIAGLSLLLAIPNIDWDWFLRRPFDWIIEEGWTNIFFDIMLITLIVVLIVGALVGFVGAYTYRNRQRAIAAKEKQAKIGKNKKGKK